MIGFLEIKDKPNLAVFNMIDSESSIMIRVGINMTIALMKKNRLKKHVVFLLLLYFSAKYFTLLTPLFPSNSLLRSFYNLIAYFIRSGILNFTVL